MRTNKKKLGYCQICKKSLCPEHTYIYVDGNNKAITESSLRLCKKCYEEKYKVKIKTEVEKFKEHLIKVLINLKTQNHIDTVRIDRLIEYINKER